MSHPNVWSRVQESPVSGGRLPSVKGFLPGLAILGLLLGITAQARSQFLYYSSDHGGYIQRANLDGSGQVTRRPPAG
jgi:hypothetical protein